ncbi:hypothetical protein DAPK24_006780 [Pichia kluyveri]|uniref:Required for respiratory growth protein 8, mitochondrial n=1 Tax=Pichia kluyveri TaxID=36015 RepID=A0AAV5QXW1_PICKL|nr:hypothetical protein DAPK24_006780 [Pichia kluyveri]
MNDHYIPYNDHLSLQLLSDQLNNNSNNNNSNNNSNNINSNNINVNNNINDYMLINSLSENHLLHNTPINNTNIDSNNNNNLDINIDTIDIDKLNTNLDLNASLTSFLNNISNNISSSTVSSSSPSSLTSSISPSNTKILITNPNPPLYIFNKPNFQIINEVPQMVKLAHRNKDISMLNISDNTKFKEIKLKLLKKLKLNNKNNKSSSSKVTKKKITSIGRPLTPLTKVRLTLIPNLPTLYSMLVTETMNLTDFKNFSKPPLYKEMKNKFKVLKRGFLSERTIYDELLIDEAVDWRFKNTTSNNENIIDTSTNMGAIFPGKSQAVTFLDDNDNDNNNNNNNNDLTSFINNKSNIFPNSIGLDEFNCPVYKSINKAVKEIFKLEEFTFLRITRAAAFEKTGAIVLKMETAKPNDKWLDDDEFDLRLLYKSFTEKEKQYNEGGENSTDIDIIPTPQPFSLEKTSNDEITTTFLKKKIARPRYKSNMRIYLIPRISDVILYTKESMLRRDIVNGTLNLNDQSDPRMIITAFNYENILREFSII